LEASVKLGKRKMTSNGGRRTHARAIPKLSAEDKIFDPSSTWRNSRIGALQGFRRQEKLKHRATGVALKPQPYRARFHYRGLCMRRVR
jgi:hypothetical protein